MLVASLVAPVLVVLLLVGLVLGGVAFGVGLALGGSVAWALWLLRAGPGRARAAIGGRPADPLAHARLHNLVDGLCSAAGVTKPELLVVDDAAPNALAFGLDARRATLVVTSGLLDRLSRIQLEGVLARELGVVKSHDIAPATIAVAALAVVGPLGPVATRVRAAALPTPPVEADASGVAITRYPPGLATALDAVGPDAAAVRAGSAATAHLWLVPPTSLVHQPLEERIAALREL